MLTRLTVSTGIGPHQIHAQQSDEERTETEPGQACADAFFVVGGILDAEELRADDIADTVHYQHAGVDGGFLGHAADIAGDQRQADRHVGREGEAETKAGQAARSVTLIEGKNQRHADGADDA